MKSITSERLASADFLISDPRWQLANRIVASGKLRRSQRLRELLLFITEQSLMEPHKALREQDIGVAVFERSANYDTSGDTIVRVHIFQLRKRLKEYFETDGSAEAILLEIPKGSYTPEFSRRASAAPVVAASPEAPAAVRHWPAWIGNWAAVLLILAAGAGLDLAFRARMASASRDSVDAFWTQMFNNHLPTEMVVADGSVSQYQEMLERNITVQEYQARRWEPMAMPIADPVRRGMADRAMVHQYTTFAETLASHNMSVIAARNNIPFDLIFARELPVRDLENKNIILGGNRRADPWMQFFEDKLNFQYGYDDEHNYGFFRNTKPRPNEQQIYRVLWDHRGYCRVAYMPNLSGSGTALILAGTDLSSAEAGERFVTSNKSIKQLRNWLSLRPGAPMPYFEILLKTDLAVASAPRFEIAAVRVQGRR